MNAHVHVAGRESRARCLPCLLLLLLLLRHVFRPVRLCRCEDEGERPHRLPLLAWGAGHNGGWVVRGCLGGGQLCTGWCLGGMEASSFLEPTVGKAGQTAF
jgi:hypothetical protein